MMHLAGPAIAALVLGLATSRCAYADVTVSVRNIDGSTVSGSWEQCDRRGSIAVGTKTGLKVFEGDDLMVVRVMNSFAPSYSENWHVSLWCTNGSVFPADLLEGGDGYLVAKTPFAHRVKLRFDELSAIRWNLQHDNAANDIEALLSRRRQSRDVLVILDGAKQRRLEGTIESLTPEGGSFNYRGKSLQFKAASSHALIFAGTGSGAVGPATCVMDDGYRIAGEILSTTQDTIVLDGGSGVTITLALPTIHEIRFKSNKIVYLSDLEPSNVQQESMFDSRWPMRRDLAVGNRPISLGGQRFAKGLGVHARSLITYQLDRDFQSFAATIGIDDLVRPSGHVIFKVLGDGEELFTSGVVTGRDEPRDVLVDLHGVRTLTLAVDEAEQLDIGDHADWADARLIK